jgi:hypothetical protein
MTPNSRSIAQTPPESQPLDRHCSLATLVVGLLAMACPAYAMLLLMAQGFAG